MSYIGSRPPADNTFVSIKSQQITGTGTDTYNLDYDATTPEDLEVFVNSIRQNPNSYTVSNQQITLGDNITASDTCYIVFQARALGTTKVPSLGVGTSNIQDSAVSTAKIADSAVTYAKSTGFGKIGQVLQTVKTDTFSTSSSSATDVTGLSVSITPTSTSSKILIQVSGNASNNENTARTHIVLAGTTSTAVGDAGTGSETTTTISTRADNDNYTQDSFAITFLDSPASTSEQTYKIQTFTGAGGTIYFNRPATQDSNGGNTISTITAMEILD